MRSQKKRIYGLFIITLMFSSLISALFSPSITPMGENFADNLYFDQIPNSQTSHTFSFLSLNGTEIQEFGTFNIYMNEFIEIIVQNSSSDDIVSVVFTYNHTINPSTSKGTVNLDENVGQFDKIVEFTYLLQSGLYNASITTYNGSSYQDFTFYLNLINPDPMIHAVYVRDITWNNVWTRIYEDQAFQTYRNTALEINVTVGNEDNINSIDTVLLYYEDGIKGTYAEDTMTTNDIPGVFGNYVVKNYTSSDIQTNFDSSTSERNKWRPQPPADNYKVGIEASDTENNEWYFNFSIEILNQAPKISIFNINNTSPDGNATINIEINATDLEDDILYESDQTNSYSYCTTPIAHNWSSSGIETVDINPMVQYLDEDDHTEINKFNFTAQDSYYDVNFTINPEYTNLTHITDFYINFTYWTNISSTIDIRVYRASDTTWVPTIFTNLTGNETLQDISNSTGLLGWDIEDFCRESNDYQIQIRFRHTTDPDLLGGDGELFHLDCINLTYITEIRTSVSSIGIQVLGPFDELISTRFIDISKMWKRSAENLWSYDYEFNSESHDYGTYTIVVKVFDYGVFTNIDPEKHYHQDIGKQLLLEEQDYGLQYFNDKITSGMRGYAIGSQVIGYNIPDAELLDLENYGVTLGDQSQADC
ncbi:MAG: hypothetical protein GY870_21355, partial [archaeon]|nr:hypothetical protein [archaeon]